MRKVVLLIVVFFITLCSQCGTVFIFEQFDNTFLSDGWTVSGTDQSYWYISETNEAGGEPNEVYFYCNNSTTWRLVTPNIDMSGIERVTFSFKLGYKKYGTAMNIGIATTADNGLHWHQGWIETFSATGTYDISTDIATEDLGKPAVKFCIFFTNTESFNVSDAYVDDISVFIQNDLDIDLQEINVAEVQPNRHFNVGMCLFNTGDTDVTSVECNYQFNDNQIVEQTFNENIPSGTFKNLMFDVSADMIPDDYILTINVTKVNGVVDDDTANNTMSKNVSVACVPAPRKPLFEHFSASSCGTCPVLSTAMDNFCNQNNGRFTYVKYMMNWPSPGDPYYTQEGNVRKTYYGVNQIPWLFMDSQDMGINAPTQLQFEEHFNELATMEIVGSYYIESSIIHVITDIMPFASLDDVRVYISVNEKVTHNNATTNGETSFHHVMMKMLPSAQGTNMSLHAGRMERLTFDFDMSGTHVEEMDDLEVAVWIQRYSTKYVYNSSFLNESEYHPYQPENIKVEKNGNTLNAIWEKPSQGNPIGYNIWLNEDLVAQNVNVNSYNFNSIDNNEFYCVQIQAVYPNDIVSVKAVATTSEHWDIQENTAVDISVYPNPTCDVITIVGIHSMRHDDYVHIYSIDGRLLKTIDMNDNRIDISDLRSGVYMMEIIVKSGSFFKKIIKM